MYRQVCCCCDYIPVCTCCCDYIPVCACFTTMLMRSAMTTAARTMYAMTTLTTERLHCLRPSRSFQLDNVAWRAACNAGVALHQPTRRRGNSARIYFPTCFSCIWSWRWSCNCASQHILDKVATEVVFYDHGPTPSSDH